MVGQFGGSFLVILLPWLLKSSGVASLMRFKLTMSNWHFLKFGFRFGELL